MALNDYSFDPNGTSNVALVSLVQGTFAFVAGQVAHTGDMKIETPVATMGIRGTTGWVQEIASVTANLGNVSYSFAVVDDFNSTGHGQYDLIDANGNIIATVSQTGYVTYVTPQGVGQAPLVSTAADDEFAARLRAADHPAGLSDPQPHQQSESESASDPGHARQFGTPPNELNKLPHLLQENGGNPFAVNIPVPGPTGTTNVSGTVTITPRRNSSRPATEQQSDVDRVVDFHDRRQLEERAPTGATAWRRRARRTSTSPADQGDDRWRGRGGEPRHRRWRHPQHHRRRRTSSSPTASAMPASFSSIRPAAIRSSSIDGTVYLLGGGTIEIQGPGRAERGHRLRRFRSDARQRRQHDRRQRHDRPRRRRADAGQRQPGTIDATPLIAGDSGVLTINTGNTVSNSGLLKRATPLPQRQARCRSTTSSTMRA